MDQLNNSKQQCIKIKAHDSVKVKLQGYSQNT